MIDIASVTLNFEGSAGLEHLDKIIDNYQQK